MIGPTSGASAGDVEDYASTNYPAVCLAEAIRRLLPEAEITAVAGTGVLPPIRRASRPPSPQPGRPTWSSSTSAARRAGTATTSPKKEGGDTANIDLPPQQSDLRPDRDSNAGPTA
jgi:beta-xylosidase